MTEKRKRRQDMARRPQVSRQDMRRESRRIQKTPRQKRSENFKGDRAVAARHEYEKALCVQVNHLKQRQVILSDNVIVL